MSKSHSNNCILSFARCHQKNCQHCRPEWNKAMIAHFHSVVTNVKCFWHSTVTQRQWNIIRRRLQKKKIAYMKTVESTQDAIYILADAPFPGGKELSWEDGVETGEYIILQSRPHARLMLSQSWKLPPRFWKLPSNRRPRRPRGRQRRRPTGSINKYGYVIVWNARYPGAKPYTCSLEHHVIMARHLGRPLRRTETIHHKNGVRNDNRLENLELWSGWHPRGQRVEDLVEWAKELLAVYDFD